MQRRDFLKLSGASVGGAIALSSVPLSLLAGNDRNMRWASYISQQAIPSQLDTWFMEEIKRRSEGAIDFSQYWSASLHGVGDHLPAVRDNRSQMSLISPGYYESSMPATRGLEWYYRMSQADALQLVCRDVYENFAPLRQEWEERHGAKVLYWTNWYHAPLVTREPINSVEDLRGKRIRAYGVMNDTIERLGGSPVPMAAPEVYTSLERGVIDGAAGFEFVTAVSYQLHEIAPHFTDMGDGPHAPAATVMSMREWESLPEEVRTLFEEVAADLYERKLAEIYQPAAEQAVETALEDGAEFATWSEEEKERARDIVQPEQVEQWKTEVAEPNGIDGDAMQEVVREAIDRHDGQGDLKTPYEIYQARG
ncbi:C4-dicarboxylate TRAP transporter substrate-binding protein [Aquisalimonas asiatica]|uniref:TRAP-type C4-dicarboxylate transport system, substrate-binding protein n=1 Tax=Aquisalimonas asiatica TaxID=406100 RepID=A0A1H8S6L2_9GAMM|nr:C4-dicarboxylate TRAP transporter substrate-binding protein [Aquisalimonas asiatica]SEO74275.1 TRAP-type C4-dicarboxylate transport system, substrate-binding protein [Aquisalimonas asiatica]